MKTGTIVHILTVVGGAAFANLLCNYMDWKAINLAANDRELYRRVSDLELKVFGDPVKDDPCDE